MELSVPPAYDVSHRSNDEYDAPMAFRRQPYWFLSFVMTPFKDIEPRTVETPTRRQHARRGR